MRKSSACHFLLVCLSLFVCLQNEAHGQGTAPATLRLNQPIVRTLEGNAPHSYQLSLSAGEFARIEVDQRGVDVAVVVLRADGEKLAESNYTGRQGFEMVSVTGGTGDMRLEIRPGSATARTGSYQIKLAVQRAASKSDQDLMAAERLMTEGWQLFGESSGARQPQSEPKYLAALALLQSAGERYGEGLALRMLGQISFRKNEYPLSRTRLNQSLAIFRELRDQREVTLTQGALCDTLVAIGDPHQALDLTSATLRYWQNAGDPYYEARAFFDMGLASSSLRDHAKAAAYFEQALALFRKLGERSREANTLGSLGNIHRRQGELEKAVQYYEQARLIQQEMGDQFNLPGTLNNLGIVYKTQGKFDKSIEAYQQALKVWGEIKLRSGEALALGNLANLYIQQSQWSAARESAARALALAEEIGELRIILGSRHALAMAAHGEGKLEEARQQLEQGLALVEAMRARILNANQRATWFSAQREMFAVYFEVLMAQHEQQPKAGHAAQALQMSERARARVLLELLTEGGFDWRRDLTPELAERERALQSQIEAAHSAQRKLLASKPTEEQKQAAARTLTLLTAEYEQLQTQIRQNHPQYAELKQTQPLSLADLQRQVLDEKTLLLEYVLGKNRSVLFAATQNALHTFNLPAADEINQAVKRYYQTLVAFGKPPVFHDLAAKEAWRKQTLHETELAAAALSHMLLDPARDLLGNKRLLIVPDGALHYMPFAALPAPQSPSSSRKTVPRATTRLSATPASVTPMIVNHEIVRMPSASALAVLRQELKGRPLAPKTLALLADPVFDVSDVRVTRNDTPTTAVAGAVIPPDKPVNAGDFAVMRDAWADFDAETIGASANASPLRLPATRLEAQALQTLVPAAERLVALDFDASRATALSEDLRQYRFVHFATHGLLNSAQPELSGLVLSLVDRQGKPQSGFLRTLDVFNMKLPAELVVLSGCRTALGKEIGGEGLVGLTRGFFYAGARRVLASLWQVNDAATAELMKRFYRGVLTNKHVSPAAALRIAQLEMLAQPRWRAPYYWAAFALQGEW